MTATPRPLGRFTFDAAGTPARAILHEGGWWEVLPADPAVPVPLSAYFTRYLMTTFGPRTWAGLPAGMGYRHHRLVHAAVADLGGTGGEVFEPPARRHPWEFLSAPGEMPDKGPPEDGKRTPRRPAAR